MNFFFNKNFVIIQEHTIPCRKLLQLLQMSLHPEYEEFYLELKNKSKCKNIIRIIANAVPINGIKFKMIGNYNFNFIKSIEKSHKIITNIYQ